MPQIPREIAQVIAVFVECIFYGLYLVTFAAIIQNVTTSHPELSWVARIKYHRSTLIVVLSIFIVSTLNLALGLVRILALINHDVSKLGSSIQLGEDWVNITKPLCIQFETMVADYVMVYRCWIVYNKLPRVVMLPILFYLGLVACTVLATVEHVALLMGRSPDVYDGQLLSWAWIGFWVSTISLNIYATSMIVFRIWRVESKSRGRNTLPPLYATPHLSRLQAAMKAVIESGLLYTVASIVTFISLATGSNSVFITTAIDIQVIGIAFNLILIRVNNRKGKHTVVEHATSTALDFAPRATTLSILTGRSGMRVITEQLNIDSKAVVDSGKQTENANAENKY